MRDDRSLAATFRRGWNGSVRALLLGALLALCLSLPFAVLMSLFTSLGPAALTVLAGVLQGSLGILFAGILVRRGY
ncbi:hypothetical protein ACFQXB_04910 [Plastorhodobacter daqingensis]|uniref:Uncharacterized protein n=1 Tax=Plastorhodobacter daqingensis TaxID=1387281 RepID=A0ABW2UHS3_9RHOB